MTKKVCFRVDLFYVQKGVVYNLFIHLESIYGILLYI